MREHTTVPDRARASTGTYPPLEYAVGDDVEVTICGRVRRLAGSNRIALLACPDGVDRWVSLPDHSILPTGAITWRPASGGTR